MNSNIDEIAEQRAMEHLWFCQFLDELSTNKLDSTVEESVAILENALEEANSKAFEQYEETNYHDSTQIDIISSQLKDIYEVKIIFLFKNVEINLKKIISMAYNITFDKNSNWSTILTILKSKNINYNTTGLPYKEVNQLRIINNSIKHSYNEMSEGMLKIKEFKRNLLKAENKGSKRRIDFAKKTVFYEDLKEFYHRVEDPTRIWINKLGFAIHSDLFKFSNKRLNKMAIELASKLDKNEATKLIENLKRLY